ncbi:MAG: serine hydrolase domain-containing protein [Spirosomataceae bacterium]
MRLLTVFLFKSLFFPFSAFSQMPIQKELDMLLNKKYTPSQAGIAVMVIKGGQVLYRKGFGRASATEAITAQTTFRMASVSKQFTAMCIMLLVKNGQMTYEDNLLKFFPNFSPTVGAKIKVRHLLTHSSGIVDYENLIPDTQKTQVSDKDVLNLLRQQTNTYFEPGSRFRYSNSGFCVLEQIVEKVSGQSFTDFITKHIFKPLKMTDTRIYETDVFIPHRAMGFARTKDGKLIDSDQSITSATKGDGCVYTSLNDYQKWYEALRTSRLLNLEKELEKVHISLPENASGNYGLGWFYARNESSPLALYHTGSSCGFSNGVLAVPSQNYLFVYFSNIADNHAVEKELAALLKKYSCYDTSFDFLKMLELTQ